LAFALFGTLWLKVANSGWRKAFDGFFDGAHQAGAGPRSGDGDAQQGPRGHRPIMTALLTLGLVVGRDDGVLFQRLVIDPLRQGRLKSDAVRTKNCLRCRPGSPRGFQAAAVGLSGSRPGAGMARLATTSKSAWASSRRSDFPGLLRRADDQAGLADDIRFNAK